MVVEFKAAAGIDSGVGDLVVARHGIASDGGAVDVEGGELHMSFPLALYDILRTEPGDATRAAEVKDAVG